MNKSKISGQSTNFFKVGKSTTLLKSSVIYGANASGKSVYLTAIKALEYLVLHSSDLKLNEPIGPYEPYKLDNNFRSLPTIFEISFFAGDAPNKGSIEYEFLVSITKERVEEETMFYYPKGVKSLLYSRKIGKDIKYGDSFRGGKKIIEKLLQDNQLFISKAAENNPDSLKNPYLFFKDKLNVFMYINDYNEDMLSQIYIKRLAEDANSKFSKRFNKLICALDTGICKISAEEMDWDQRQFSNNIPDDVKSKLMEKYKYDIKTTHPEFQNNTKIGEISFRIEEESTGTSSLFVLGGIILDVLDKGRVLVIDELEKNLHPAITTYLIKLFHNPITNPNNAQLIFATHDISQLTSEVFRRDQVWFTEKDEFGVTSLFRCSDITGIRLNAPLDKWYSSGRFGATPIINDIEFLIEMQG